MVGEARLRIEGLSDFQEVGSGGFAITYAAYEADQDRTVAVKVLHEADEAGRRRFDRERRTMGTTTGHPNIVTLFRSGYTDDANKPYLVMEYLAGGSLEDRIDRSGPMGLDDAIGAIVPVAEALGFSHASGILHKDVKPANILVAESGTVKLTDFGIAALKESTGTSQVAYSPAYAPPESFDARWNPETGEVIDLRDERSDLYSLAATLYTLCIGAPPYGGSQLSLMRQIADLPVPATGHDGLDRFLAVAMAKNPDHRYQSADAFVAALGWITADAGAVVDAGAPTRVVGPPPRPEPAGASFAPPQPWPSHGPTADRAPGTPEVSPAPATGKRGPAIVGAAALAAVGVVGVGLIMASGGGGGGGGSGSGDVDTPTVAGPIAAAAEPGAESVAVYDGHGEDVRDLVLLPEGRVLSTSVHEVRVWDPDRPDQTEVTFDETIFDFYDLALLPDGRLASAAGAWVNIWAADTPDRRADDYQNDVLVEDALHVTVLPDGRVASNADSKVNVWDPADTTITEAVYRGHDGQIRALAALPNGWIASAGNTTIHVWDPAQPDTAIVVYEGHDTREQLEAIANSVNDDEPRRVVPVFIKDIVVLPDGRVVSSAIDGFENLIHIWDPTDLDAPVVTRSVPNGANTLLVLADGRVAEGRDDGAIAIWNPVAPATPDAEFSGHGAAVRDMIELPDGRIVSAGDGPTVRIWDPTCAEADTSPIEGLRCLRVS